MKSLMSTLAALLLTGCAVTDFGENPCKSLEAMELEAAVITEVRAVSGGKQFSFPGLFVGKPFFQVPASCRVSIRHTPSPESDIRSEVWFPQGQWNGKFLGVGNGGFAGSIDKISLTVALEKHYAVASTDTGHESSDKDGRWALNQPEKIRDYGYRAIHDMTVSAKKIINTYYGQSPEYSYFSSCSNGGRAGLMEAQRFPEDYDGIVAGAPAYYPSGMLSIWGWIQQTTLRQKESWIPEDKVDLIAAAVLEACDGQDGVADGVINHPPACQFDPESLLCPQDENGNCLSQAQVESLKAIYRGPGGEFEGRPNRGFEPGGELGRGAWKEWITGAEPGGSLQSIYVEEFYRYLIASDPDWTLKQFEFPSDQVQARRAFEHPLDAVSPDLEAFYARGGKLILYHGWSDAAVPPRLSIDYVNAVRNRLGAERADNFVRLYMVPGLQHCIGGPGANNFGMLPPAGKADPTKNINAAMERWVEEKIAPEAITATKYDGNEFKAVLAPEKATPLFSRKLCPYPQIAKWDGVGSQDQATSYNCVSD